MPRRRAVAKTIKAAAGRAAGLPSFAEYVAGVIGQVSEAAQAVRSLEGKPGDLDVMRREWARTIGLVVSLAERTGGAAAEAAGREEGSPLARAYEEIASLCRAYSESYSFAREIDTMSGLYADDPGRLRNMRLKMCESYDGGRFLEKLEGLAREIGGEGEAEGGNAGKGGGAP